MAVLRKTEVYVYDDVEIVGSEDEVKGGGNFFVVEKKENRKKRINFTIQPSLLKRIDDHVKLLGISRSEFFCQLSEKYLDSLEK